MLDCPVCDAPAELVRTWDERNPGSAELTRRAILRCVRNHWVAMDAVEVPGWSE